jgi:hypothetical protein
LSESEAPGPNRRAFRRGSGLRGGAHSGLKRLSQVLLVMTKKLKKIVIPKDKAAFWLDRNGCWRNRHGKFEHKKIIDYFHASIRKDKDGYYVGQAIENCREKVYFHYEDTALLVFDVIKNKDLTLILNTGKQIKLKPRKLEIKADNLYLRIGNERIKFAEKSLIKISDLLKCVEDQFFIRVHNRNYKIQKL